jgi:hypothetical protein
VDAYFERSAARGRDREAPAEDGASGGHAQRHDDLRLDRVDLGVEPGRARTYLVRVRLRVDPPLPARLPLEVLDGVRDPHLLAGDTGVRSARSSRPAGPTKGPGAVFVPGCSPTMTIVLPSRPCPKGSAVALR